MSVVGIDLGTTISSLAVADEAGAVRLARLRDGTPRLRSVVSVETDGRIVVGDEAQALAPLDPDATFAFFKRRMGTGWTVPHGDEHWTAPRLSAEVLKALVDDAAADLGSRPRQAAVTIPAYFGDDARRATLEAGALAGLDVVALPHEPTAACLAYEPEPGRTSTQLVYDLGGGTFDVSVVRFTPHGAEVLATAGDDHLGGKDWDDVLVDLVADQVEEECGTDPRDDTQLVTDLLERAREVKHALSAMARTTVTLPVGRGLRRVEITRTQFETLAAPLYARTATVVQQVLDDVGGAGVIDAVLLVGGSSRMPKCREALIDATGLAPLRGVDPDAAVVTGAALVARHETAGRARPAVGGAVGAQRVVRDVTAHALGFVVVAADGSRYVNEVMIDRNAPIPVARTKRHQLSVAHGDTGVLDVFMLQGEAERPLDTNPLGRWAFEGVPGSHTGLVDVEVTYEYDTDGVVRVTAAVGGSALAPPRIDRDERDLRWTDEDPASHLVPDLTVALVIDVSSSMSGRALSEAQDACCSFVDELEEAGLGDRIVLVPFGTSATIAAPLGSAADRVRDAARGLSANGTTNMAHGLSTAWAALGAADGRRVVVVLTDGAPNSRPDALAQRHVIVGGDGEIIARGVTGADAAFLRELDSGSRLLGDGEVVSSFRGIARQLTSGSGMARGSARGALRMRS